MRRLLSIALLAAAAGWGQNAEPRMVRINAPYVETPPEVVDAMLDAAQVKAGDVVYDLGCGDGRILIAAARRFGVHGVGVDISAEHIAQARRNAEKAGVASLVDFRVEDLFEMDLGKATVVTLYLLRSVNLELRPKLLAELAPGTRIVSHEFDMGDWKPARQLQVHGSKIFLWVIPPRP